MHFDLHIDRADIDATGWALSREDMDTLPAFSRDFFRSHRARVLAEARDLAIGLDRFVAIVVGGVRVATVAPAALPRPGEARRFRSPLSAAEYRLATEALAFSWALSGSSRFDDSIRLAKLLTDRKE